MESELQEPEASAVAHVVVVGFHAQLGNRIEFAYPRLRGDPVLRSPKVTDTTDISSGSTTPGLAQSILDWKSTTPPSPLAHHWGELPEEWSFLPFMALPDGVHDHAQDVVFFTLPPDVHCVACFRQVLAHSAKTHAAAGGQLYEKSVAARGSVQKSVVLLCRRPLFGVLADRLVPAVRAYFEQADFADTQVLSSLFHSLNVSLARPSLCTSDTLFHGLDLRALVQRLGPQLGALIKLVLLERRVVFYSQPVRHASNAVIALASVFAGALDTIAPTLRPLDERASDRATGLPLSLFGLADRVNLQPYAPLPLLSELIPNHRRNGCILGTSHNVGLLLSSTASAHARKVADARRGSSSSALPLSPIDATRAALQSALGGTTVLPQSARPSRSQPTLSPPPALQLHNDLSSASLPARTRPLRETLPHGSETPTLTPTRAGGVPVVDALVNLSTGRVAVAATLEPFCRLTHAERIFFRDLMAAASQSAASVSSSGATGPFIGSDDYLRSRIRTYLARFLQSIASINGVLGGPVGGETWSDEMLEEFDFSTLDVYNETFVRKWLTTRNAAEWARRCNRPTSIVSPPPGPEIDPLLSAEGLAPVDRVTAGLRRNVAGLSKLTSFVSAKAVDGLSGLFKRIEQEVAKMDTAVGEANSNHNSPRVASNKAQVLASKQHGFSNGDSSR